MRVNINGPLNKGVLSKDLILHVISKLSANGATGHFIEFAGSTIRNLSMEARMTICNMSIEMGAKGGLIAPDRTTFNYMKGKTFAPSGGEWKSKVAEWHQLYSDPHAEFDHEVYITATEVEPMITYGTDPGMGLSVSGTIPTGNALENGNSTRFNKSLTYMGFKPGEKIKGKKIDYVFIGSCTNSRIEDLRMVASFIKDKKRSPNVEVWVVPGSKQVEEQARKEGIDKIFEKAGFALRQPGCSACLGMNEDKIPAGKYCVSTSNRNFEGRQGPNARTLLASPLTAALAAITGEICDIREWL
jgi:3-isopropylmalate/(R)-2-methylmalate dehydratase large subunit